MIFTILDCLSVHLQNTKILWTHHKCLHLDLGHRPPKRAKLFWKILVGQASRPNDLRFHIYIQKYVQSFLVISFDVILIHISTHHDVRTVKVDIIWKLEYCRNRAWLFHEIKKFLNHGLTTSFSEFIVSLKQYYLWY